MRTTMPEQSSLPELLLSLLTIDAAFVVAHLIWAEDHKRWWNLGEDLSAAEFFQYGKLGIAAVLMFALWRRLKEVILLGWSGIFAFLTLDDALQGHERVGGNLMRLFMDDAETLAFADFRWQDIGELLAAFIFVAPMLVALALGWKRATGPVRNLSKKLFASCALLALAGVGIDFFVNGMAGDRFGELAFFLEDGTEMVAASLIAWFVYRAWSGRQLQSVDIRTNRTGSAHPTDADTLGGYGKATLTGGV